jgi:hypothetical protein
MRSLLPTQERTVIVLRNPLQQQARIQLALGEQQWSLDLPADSFHSVTIA